MAPLAIDRLVSATPNCISVVVFGRSGIEVIISPARRVVAVMEYEWPIRRRITMTRNPGGAMDEVATFTGIIDPSVTLRIDSARPDQAIADLS